MKDSLVDELAKLDSQVRILKEQQTYLEAEQKELHQELKRLYSALMTEFDKRWPPLKRISTEQ